MPEEDYNIYWVLMGALVIFLAMFLLQRIYG
jgi:hypothetical protein